MRKEILDYGRELLSKVDNLYFIGDNNKVKNRYGFVNFNELSHKESKYLVRLIGSKNIEAIKNDPMRDPEYLTENFKTGRRLFSNGENFYILCFDLKFEKRGSEDSPFYLNGVKYVESDIALLSPSTVIIWDRDSSQINRWMYINGTKNIFVIRRDDDDSFRFNSRYFNLEESEIIRELRLGFDKFTGISDIFEEVEYIQSKRDYEELYKHVESFKLISNSFTDVYCGEKKLSWNKLNEVINEVYDDNDFDDRPVEVFLRMKEDYEVRAVGRRIKYSTKHGLYMSDERC